MPIKYLLTIGFRRASDQIVTVTSRVIRCSYIELRKSQPSRNPIQNQSTQSIIIMKIFSISIILAPRSGACAVLSNANDLSSFSFYQKGSVAEFMTFFSKTVAERTPQGQRQSVQENNYTAHVYNRGGADQLAGEDNP